MTPVDLALLAVAIGALCLCALLLLRARGGDQQSRLAEKVERIGARLDELAGAVAAGIGGIREDTASSGRQSREDQALRFDALSRGLGATVETMGTLQAERLDALAKQVSQGRIETENHAQGLRRDLAESFNLLAAQLGTRFTDQAAEQARRLDGFAATLGEHRTATGTDAQALRQEVGATLAPLGQRLAEALDVAARKQGESLAAATDAIRMLSEANERRQDALRQTVEARLDSIRVENAQKLEEMRVTVDEKLQGTLEQRLGASFATVNENLERVFRSVGEMQTIATGVGDLKRVLSNVKSRGTWGETTLGLLLEQVMTPEQYAQNVEVRPGSGCRVEYAVKLPGDGDTPVWLPIDAKLPTEDYERLVEASERGDAAAVEEAVRGLERAIRKCGQDIGTKYVDPPHSTDFGIMFLPTEGLFAEVARRPGLVDALQRECRVTVAGPTTLMATLVALRMGFRSLAIQKRSSEVWQVLGAVKSEFGKFGDVLDKVQKKLAEAQNVVESAAPRRRALDRKLRSVEALPESAAREVLALDVAGLADDAPVSQNEDA